MHKHVKIKNSIILGLAATLVFFSVFCCCPSGTAHAGESVPACHQSNQAADAPQGHSSKDCHCREMTNPAVIEKAGGSPGFTQVVDDWIPVPEQKYASFVPILRADQAPPEILKGFPSLYLRNSILRL